MASTDVEPGYESQAILASVIEKLVATFNASNDKTMEDPTKRQIQSSVFNNKLKGTGLQQSENKIIQSLNGGEPGLYALILRSQEIEAIAEGNRSSWWSLIMDIPVVVGAAVDAAEEAVIDLVFPPEEEIEALKALELLDFKGYYIFILTDVGDENPIPITMPPTEGVPDYTYTNLDS